MQSCFWKYIKISPYSFFHCRGKILHLDIKSANIVLDDNWNARLIDFGLSRDIGQGNNIQTTHVRNPDLYSSPSVSPQDITTHRDIFALGIGMYVY